MPRSVSPSAESGGGAIVNIGSFFDKIGVKRNLAYCASKAAVGAITRCLAVEWANRGHTRLDVAPGYIETDLNRDAMTRGRSRLSAEAHTSGRPARQRTSHGLVAAIFSEDINF